MRAALLFAFALQASPSFAADFECVWQALPGETQAAMTENVHGAQEVASAMRSALTEATLLPAIETCRFDTDDAHQLGQYFAARAIAVAQHRQLREFGLSDAQVEELVRGLTSADRAFIMRWNAGARDESSLGLRLKIALAAQSAGIAANNDAGQRAALEYVMGRVTVEMMSAAAAAPAAQSGAR